MSGKLLFIEQDVELHVGLSLLYHGEYPGDLEPVTVAGWDVGRDHDGPWILVHVRNERGELINNVEIYRLRVPE